MERLPMRRAVGVPCSLTRASQILASGPMRSEAGPSSANQQAEFYLGTVTGAGRRRSWPLRSPQRPAPEPSNAGRGRTLVLPIGARRRPIQTDSGLESPRAEERAKSDVCGGRDPPNADRTRKETSAPPCRQPPALWSGRSGKTRDRREPRGKAEGRETQEERRETPHAEAWGLCQERSEAGVSRTGREEEGGGRVKGYPHSPVGKTEGVSES